MRFLDGLRRRGRDRLADHEGVSCDPERLYADGGFYDGHLGLDRLLEVSRRARGSFTTLAEVFPRVVVDRPPPAAVDSADPAWIATHLDQLAYHGAALDVVAPSLLVRIRDVLLWRGILFVKVEGRYAPVYELYRSIDRAFKPEGLAERIGRQSVRKVKRSRDAAFLYVGSAGTLNYGHWLVDDLPALAAIPTLRERYRQVQVVMTSQAQLMDDTRAGGVATALGGAPGTAWRFVFDTDVFRFDELHFVTPHTFHPLLKNPSALPYLRSLLPRLAPAAGAAPQGERLFVNRSAAFRRRLANEADVVGLLARFGFREIVPERMTLAEQWLAFGAARQVVGLMGAGMTNTLFMWPGADLLYLAFEGWPDPFFWDLAAMGGHRYAVTFGSRPMGAEESFTVDLETLANRLRWMTSGGDRERAPERATSR